MKHIFVLGAPRSGGTLVYNILCNDLETNPPVSENHLINDQCKEIMNHFKYN